MAAVSLSEFADSLDGIMFDIGRAFIRRQPDELYKGKISMPQFFLMMSLKKQGESKMTDIAHFLGVTTAAATGVVDRLVKGGYCTRVFDPQDRRIIKARLSLKGAGTVHNVIQQRRQMIIDIFGKISEKDRSDYLRILTQIQDILRRQTRNTQKAGAGK